jgi:hypothetical protein
MRISTMIHPVDRNKFEHWALARGYGYKLEMSLLSQGYILAHFEAANGSNNATVVRDLIENGVRVMSRPGVVMTSADCSGMERLSGLVEDAKSDYIADYIKRAKEISPSQPESWYARHADANWNNTQRLKGEAVHPNLGGGTRVRIMKRKRAAMDLNLKKRARKIIDDDFYW